MADLLWTRVEARQARRAEESAAARVDNRITRSRERESASKLNFLVDSKKELIFPVFTIVLEPVQTTAKSSNRRKRLRKRSELPEDGYKIVFYLNT